MSIEVHIQHKLRGFYLNVEFESCEKRIGILGASGCGKSMTLQSVAGIVTPDAGRITVDGRVFFDSMQKINVSPQKRKVGYLFQNYALFPEMTVERNIAMGLRGKKREETAAVVREMMKRFKLDGLAGRYPRQLSGGQQQRVALARIMAYEPEVIMLDEPFSALDTFLKDAMRQEMKNLLETYGKTVLMVSHSRDEIYEFSDLLLIMDHGKLVEYGPTKEVFAKPRRLETAKLTGCKNISRAKKLGPYRVYAEEWGLTLHTAETVPDLTRYVGFRAHDITEARQGEQNAFSFEVISRSETPFEVVYLLKKRGKEEPETGEHFTVNPIWWKVPRSRQELPYADQFPEYLRIAEESLFLLQ